MDNASPLFSQQKLRGIIWPLLTEQLLTVLVGMIDVLMVAQIGESAVSGVSLVDSVNHLFIMALLALTTGGTVVTAKALGSADRERSSKASAQLFFSAVTVMTLISILIVAFRAPLVRTAFGKAEDAVQDNAVRYLFYTGLSFPFLAAYQSGSAVFRAKGNTRLSMRVALGMNILNIAGNALCIFVLGMGVEGVAVPTLIARAAAGTVMVFFVQRDADLRIASLSTMRPDGRVLGEILSVGVPASLESALFNLGKVMLQSLVSTLGTASIAAYAVASNLVNYLYLPGNAINAAMTTVVGQCWGAGRTDEARGYVRKLIMLNYLMLLVIATGAALLRHTLVGFYNLSGEAAVYAAALFLSHCTAMLIWPLAFDLPYYFRATSRAAYTMTVALSAMAVFRVGLSYLFVGHLGKSVLWVWYAMFADWIFRSLIFVPRFLKDERTGYSTSAGGNGH